jgi:hypothetical protein
MKRMNHIEYRALIDALGLTQVGAGEFLGVGDRTSRRYAGGGPIPGPVIILLRYMARKKLKPEDVSAITEERCD